LPKSSAFRLTHCSTRSFELTANNARDSKKVSGSFCVRLSCTALTQTTPAKSCCGNTGALLHLSVAQQAKAYRYSHTAGSITVDELARALDACADWFDACGKDTDHLLVVMGALCELHGACVECLARTSNDTINAVRMAAKRLRIVCNSQTRKVSL